MKPSTKTLLAILPFALLQWTCGEGLLQRRLTEGVIEYALSFPDYDPNGLMSGMLPERTTITFADGQQVAELSAGMGVFRTTLIADNETEQLDYLLSILSKKIVARMHERDMQHFNKDGRAFTILYTGQVDTIAGYPCRKAVAIFNDIRKPEIELYYTDRIQLENPNWFGPFSDIPGVLLSYEVVQYGMRMRLDAVAVTTGPIDPSKFEVKKEYEPVAPEVLHHELEEVLSTFTL